MLQKSKLIAGLLAAATIVGAAASATAGASTGAHAKSAASKITTVDLGYVPYSNDSSLFVGIKEGFFRKEGLKVNLTTAAAPTAVIAAMESGQEQFGFVTTVVLVNAAAHGTDLKCVSSVDGNQTSNASADGTLLLAAPGSGIKSIADLKGKTVATVQLASLNTLDVQEMAKEAGYNPGEIKFVPMGFAEMPQALKQGTVQAAVITTPFSATAQAEGATLIAHPNVTVMSGQSTTCFASTDSYLNHHVKVAREFQAAMATSIAFTKTHLDTAAATLVPYGLATSVKSAEQSKLGTDFNPVILPASLAKIERLLERFKYITASIAPQPKSLIFAGA